MGEVAIALAVLAVAGAIRDAGVRISDAIVRAQATEGGAQ